MARRTKILLSFFIPALLLVAFAVVWICNFNQWDALTFVTVVPFWIWAVPGMLVSLIAAIVIRTRFSVVVFAIWFLTTISVSAEIRGLFRAWFPITIEESEMKQLKTLRLVTINCADGNLKAAQEAMDLDPDIILLQEAPDRRHIEQLTWRTFGGEGSFLYAGTNSIIGRGKFITFVREEGSSTIHARLKHVSGAIVDLTNVQFDEAIPDLKVWLPSVRQQMRETRVKNRKAIRTYIGDYEADTDQPVRIVAGSFMTPPGDDIFRPLKNAKLRDAYPTSGIGTGNTFPAKLPILRLDQVWMSPDATPLVTETKRSEHTDHRIVTCEFAP